jgi:hypothetical protein
MKAKNATTSTVDRKLYITALCLAWAWAFAVVAFFGFLFQKEPEPLDPATVATIAGVSLGPVLILAALNRWFRWVRKP